MSLNRNIAANYGSQVYTVLVGVATMPLYLKYMGPESFGLIGFFTAMQAWFGLLDLGLTPTISRETARYFGGSLNARTYQQLLRALSVIFFIIAVIGGSGIWLGAECIASRWLEFKSLPVSQVVTAVELIGGCVAMRWMAGLYRGVVTGSEKLVWLSAFNSGVATLRFVAVFPVMAIFGFTPTVYFLHQFAVAALELAGLLLKSRSLAPGKDQLSGPIGWSFRVIQPLLRFSLTMAFTSVMWITVTQSDRLILSGVLGLSDYGYFSMAVLVASGVIMIASPVSVAITPRLTRLFAEGQDREFFEVYRNATRLVTAITGTVAITLAPACLANWIAAEPDPPAPA